jgi:hypothetical protein
MPTRSISPIAGVTNGPFQSARAEAPLPMLGSIRRVSCSDRLFDGFVLGSVEQIALLSFAIVCVCGCSSKPSASQAVSMPLTIHPVFDTPITGQSSARPAIRVDIVDASESWFASAELYLTVQSSRFPANTLVILPLNIGDFQGCRSRFIQLPFEVKEHDQLVFNLLDDDELSSDEEKLLLELCRLTGYAVVLADRCYQLQLGQAVAPLVSDSAALLSTTFLLNCSTDRFDNYGTAEFIVPKSMPLYPHEANKLALLDESNYARVVLRIYGPGQPLLEELEVTAL